MVTQIDLLLAVLLKLPANTIRELENGLGILINELDPFGEEINVRQLHLLVQSVYESNIKNMATQNEPKPAVPPPPPSSPLDDTPIVQDKTDDYDISSE